MDIMSNLLDPGEPHPGVLPPGDHLALLVEHHEAPVDKVAGDATGLCCLDLWHLSWRAQ